MERVPTSDQIQQMLHQGCSYAEVIDGAQPDVIRKTNKVNFKDISNRMAKKDRDSKKMQPEDINRETFVWRTRDKEVTLNEMDADFKLAALVHCLNKANENHSKYESHERERKKHERKRDHFKKNVAYFMAHIDVLQDALELDHNLQTPNAIEDVASMRRMIKEGIIKVDKFDSPIERGDAEPKEAPSQPKDPKAEEQSKEKQL